MVAQPLVTNRPLSQHWYLGGRIISGTGSDAGLAIVDSGLTDAPVVAAVHAWLASLGRSATWRAVNLTPSFDEVSELAGSLGRPGFLLAIGGGRILDAVKLASLMAESSRVRAHLTVPQRCGAVVVPMDVRRTRPLVAIPTTLGTGSESSAVVVVDDESRRRLVMGQPLAPEGRILDPLATGGLAPHVVAEGLLEVLARLTAPYLGSSADPLADALVEALVGRVIALGTHLRRSGLPGDARLELAEISSLSHDHIMGRRRDPYAVKSWLIGSELARAAGVRKMTALSAVLPVYWARISGGDTRFGDPDRLVRIWDVVRRTHRGAETLPMSPSDGLVRLMSEWGINTLVHLDPADRTALTAHIMRAWGTGLPMLGALRADDIAGVLAEATGDPAARACPAPSPVWPVRNLELRPR
jgi:NADP-dependent alcohol dehydrogenase